MLRSLYAETSGIISFHVESRLDIHGKTECPCPKWIHDFGKIQVILYLDDCELMPIVGLSMEE